MIIKLEYKAISLKIYELMNIAREVGREIDLLETYTDELFAFWNSMAEAEYYMRIMADLYNAKALNEKIKQEVRVFSEGVKRFDDAEKRVNEMIVEM